MYVSTYSTGDTARICAVSDPKGHDTSSVTCGEMSDQDY